MTEPVGEWFGEFFVLHRPGLNPGGQKLHFAHATGFNATTYRALLNNLDAEIDAFAVDFRGHGRTKAPSMVRKLSSWGDFARDLTKFLQILGAPTLLVGHSMGATVSLQVAAENPELVSGLLLIEPVIISGSHRRRVQLARLAGLTQFMAMPRKARQRTMEFESREAAIENYVGKGPFRTWPRATIEDYINGGTVTLEDGRVRLSCDREWEAQTFATVTPNPLDYVARLEVPTTLLVGGAGSTCDEESRAAFLALQPNMRVVEYKDGTHFIPMEFPERVCSEVSELLARVSHTSGT